jgi:alpha-D-ribose 1-methylphosphonate 5-triphosphate synthase subunit PhnG
MTIALSDQDKTTMRIAAYGAVTLLSAAGAAGGSPHTIATRGSIALGSGTGLVGHVLASYPKGKDLNGRSVAAIADRVLPALTAAMGLLRQQAPDEAANFRGSVLTAIEAAIHDSQPGPVVTDMIGKITKALDAA